MTSRAIILTAEDIRKRVAELGSQISKDFRRKELLVIGVLNGAFIFTADLVRKIDIPLQIDFIRVSSYGTATTSSKTITLTKKNEIPLSNQDILLVEDIVDTGRTTAWLQKYLQQQTSGKVYICTLIDKKERREKDITIDYTGFHILKGFLVGYGLDFAEKFRHYPDVFHLEEQK
jgi:hypoxanthine phosphoribosyltransferase